MGFFGLSGQDLGLFNVRSGFANYPLGSAFPKSDTSLKIVYGGTFEYKGRAETTYFFPGVEQNQYQLDGVVFQYAHLTYASGKLIHVSLFKSYLKSLDSNFIQKAKKESEQVLMYLNEQWNSNGKKSSKNSQTDRSYVVKTRTWKGDNRTMLFTFHEQKEPKLFYLIEVSLQLDEDN